MWLNKGSSTKLALTASNKIDNKSYTTVKWNIPYIQGLLLITSSNFNILHMNNWLYPLKGWDEITNPFPNYNDDVAVEIWDRIISSHS